MSTNGLVRLGILALPVSGVLGLVALIGRYGTPNASVDPKAAARTASSLGYFVTQFVGNVLGLTLLIFGILALTVYLSNTRARRFAVAAMILSILGVAPVLSALGVTTYALPVLGKAYLNGQQDILPIIDDIFDNPLRIIFDFVFLSYAAGFVLFGVAIWRSGVLRKGAALSLGLHAPLVSSFIRPEPSIGVIVGAVMFVVGGALVSLDVLRGTGADHPR
jgi:hypothetical protein